MNSVMEKVCDVCTTVRNDSKLGVTFPELLVKLRKQFKRQDISLKIRSQRSKTLAPEEFYVNAYYDAEDDRNLDIPIEVVVHNNFDKTHLWDQKHITEFLIQVYDAVIHEHKHQRQSKKRNHESYWLHVSAGYNYKEYLEDPDEIDAYAFSIAVELCRSLGKYRALRYMHKFSSMSKLKFKDGYASPNLNAYISHFNESNPKLLKTLAKKIYVRLQKVDADYIFQ